MKKRSSILILLLTLLSCKEYIVKEVTHYEYYDILKPDELEKANLIAITNEENLEYGVDIAFIDRKGDTIIPFGKYAYYGTDSLEYYANVLEHPNDSSWGRQLAIDKDQNVLFDLVMFDNGPEPFHENVTRVLRNGKMGFANKYGQVTIPCIYDYAKWFNNGKAEVSFNAKEYFDWDQHRRVESKEWFEIDKQGRRIK